MFPKALRGDGTVQEAPFSSLPTEFSNVLERDKFDVLNRLVLVATTPIQTMPPSGWYAHAPVLFCLFELFRPRRYVELGSHNGYSFFAACQGAEITGSKTECIAIDGWEGDKHAGFYDSKIYDSVRKIVSSKYPLQYTLKAFFDDAIGSFEDRSIDLLHIDGFHTYQAVKNDFESWLPKMSERGIILFHDTNVYESDFGVYILWQKIKRNYPSVEFKHQSGLGILFVGSDESIKNAFAVFTDHAEYKALLQNLIHRVADLNVSHSLNAIATAFVESKNMLEERKRQLKTEKRRYLRKYILAWFSSKSRLHYKNKLRSITNEQDSLYSSTS